MAPQRSLFATFESKGKKKRKDFVLQTSLAQFRQIEQVHTPGTVTLLLPTRQSRRISLSLYSRSTEISFYADSYFSSAQRTILKLFLKSVRVLKNFCGGTVKIASCVVPPVIVVISRGTARATSDGWKSTIQRSAMFVGTQEMTRNGWAEDKSLEDTWN